MATETPPSKPSPELSSTTPAPPTADPPPPAAVSVPASAPATTPNATPSISATTPATLTPRLPEPDVIHIPSYSRWFSWDAVHECEARFLPEFFDGRSPSKNPRVYKYYRNAIIRHFRENPTRKITFTEVRKTIVGDVGSIRRVFDFLDAWGLINYVGSNSKPQLKWEDKDNKSTATAAQGGDGATSGGGPDIAPPKKRVCSGCKTPCTIACFASEKHDMTLCARCYVRGNYRVGLSSSDFKRVEISDEGKTDWIDKDTLQLLEAVMHYGDDWKKVAEHVSGRSAKECAARFIKLPFGEQFDGPPESAELDTELDLQNVTMSNKRIHLSPLADASNPIMAQAVFLSTLVGVDVAEQAARAAVAALPDLGEMKQESANASNGHDTNAMEKALGEAKLEFEREEEELEKVISGIATQAREIEDKMAEFEELELQMERKWQQFQHLQNRLYADQLTVLFHKTAGPKTGESPIKID